MHVWTVLKTPASSHWVGAASFPLHSERVTLPLKLSRDFHFHWDEIPSPFLDLRPYLLLFSLGPCWGNCTWLLIVSQHGKYILLFWPLHMLFLFLEELSPREQDSSSFHQLPPQRGLPWLFYLKEHLQPLSRPGPCSHCIALPHFLHGEGSSIGYCLSSSQISWVHYRIPSSQHGGV